MTILGHLPPRSRRRGLAALAALAVTAPLALTSAPATAGEPGVASTAAPALVVTVLTDPHDSPTTTGDVVGFSLRVTNASDSAVTISPATSNLAGASRCRWVRIEPGATKTDCTGMLSRTITAADADAGSFTPRLTYQVHSVLGDYSSAPAATLDVAGSPVAAQGPDEIVVELD